MVWGKVSSYDSGKEISPIFKATTNNVRKKYGYYHVSLFYFPTVQDTFFSFERKVAVAEVGHSLFSSDIF